MEIQKTNLFSYLQPRHIMNQGRLGYQPEVYFGFWGRKRQPERDLFLVISPDGDHYRQAATYAHEARSDWATQYLLDTWA